MLLGLIVQMWQRLMQRNELLCNIFNNPSIYTHIVSVWFTISEYNYVRIVHDDLSAFILSTEETPVFN